MFAKMNFFASQLKSKLNYRNLICILFISSKLISDDLYYRLCASCCPQITFKVQDV